MLIVCYTGLLLPALGFVKIYFMRYSLVADHYQYAAMIVPCAVFAGAAVTLARRRPDFPRTGYALCLGLLATLAVLTWRQSRMYADVETLFRTTVDRNPDCWMAHHNLARVLAERGELDSAIIHYRNALELKPDFAEAHYNLGNALARRGEFDSAIAHYQKALELKPNYTKAHFTLAVVLVGRGRVDSAIAHYQKALELKPDFTDARCSLAAALVGRGQLSEAIPHYRKALEIEPDSVAVLNNLAWIRATHSDPKFRDGREAVTLRKGPSACHRAMQTSWARWPPPMPRRDGFPRRCGPGKKLCGRRSPRAMVRLPRKCAPASSYTRTKSLIVNRQADEIRRGGTRGRAAKIKGTAVPGPRALIRVTI